MIIATAGHVDHGKTSLVRHLTGIDTDRLDEEKQRGLTIDLGFAYANSEEGTRLGFIDVPGHIRFINNMLAGVSVIDYALLVVAADDGVMPQTIEHLDILKILDIGAGCIAITKIDRCSEDQVASTIEAVSDLVRDSFLQGAGIYPVSNETGEGIEDLQLDLDIAASDVTRNDEEGMFRLAIDRRFSVKGSGIVVTGSVFGGKAAVGDELFLQPHGEVVRVRSMHTQNQSAETASTGDRCAINLTGNVDLEEISRGNWLTANPAVATDRIDIRLDLLASQSRAFKHWTPVHVHTAANHISGRVALLEGSSLAPGESGLAQLVLDEPINTCAGDRVVIRDQGAEHTLGGGRVLDPTSPRRGRSKPERLDHLKAITPQDVELSLSQLLKSSPKGLSGLWFQQAFNLDDNQMAQRLELISSRQLDDNWLIAEDHLATCLTHLTTRLDSWHDDNPAKAGLSHNQIATLDRSLNPALVAAITSALLETGELEQHGNLLSRPGRVVRLSNNEQSIWNKARPLIEENLTCPPVLHELASAITTDPKQLERTLVQVVKAGMLVRPVKNRFFLPEGIAALRSLLADAVDANGEITVQQYRDLAGIGRNLTIEMLEYFDRLGVTRRQGNSRKLLDP